jgi:superfamily II DNA helicase RecQ
MALTATATPVVQRQVAETLKLHPAGGAGRAGSLVVKTSFNRPNLVYEVHGCAAG